MKTEWEKTQLGDVCKVIPGFAFKSQDWQVNGIPVLKIKNIQNDGTVDIDNLDYVPKELLTPSMKKFLLNDGDILIAMTGATAGKVGKLRTTHRIFLNQRVAKIEPINANIQFIWSVVSSGEYRRRFFHLADGAAQPNMSGSQIESTEIPLPPLPIQRKIAGILSAYDDLIENNTRRIAILEEMAQRIYKEWFVDFKYPGHENDKMLESGTELGMIPEGWEVRRLEELSKRITDGSHLSPISVDDGFPMASVKDMHNWGFNVGQCRKISKEDFRKLVKSDCKPLMNDVLIAKDGSYLKHIFVIEEEIDLVILSSIAIIRPNDLIKPHILALYLKLPHIKSMMTGYVSGAALPRIILKDFRKFLTLLPPIELQDKINGIIKPVTDYCYDLVRANRILHQTRDLLLPMLISGKVDVTELDIDIGET